MKTIILSLLFYCTVQFANAINSNAYAIVNKTEAPIYKNFINSRNVSEDINLKILVQEYLTNEGFKYEIDKDGDICFKYQGHTFFFSDPIDDPYFFRIFMSPIYKIANNREKVLEAINTVTSKYKLLKAYILNDELWLSIELFVDSTPKIEDYFQRCIEILSLGREGFAIEIFSE